MARLGGASVRHVFVQRPDSLDRVMSQRDMRVHLRGRLRFLEAEIERLFGEVNRGAGPHDPHDWWRGGADAEWVQAWSKLNYLLHARDDIRQALDTRALGPY